MESTWQFALIVSILPAIVAFCGIAFTRFHTARSENIKWINTRFLDAAVEYFSIAYTQDIKGYGRFLTESRESGESSRCVMSRMATNISWNDYVKHAVQANEVYVKLLILTPAKVTPYVIESFKTWDDWLHFFSTVPKENVSDAEYKERFDRKRKNMVDSRQELRKQIHRTFRGRRTLKKSLATSQIPEIPAQPVERT